MQLLLDAFWRAAAYCLHPRVIVLSLAPLVIAAGLAWLLGHNYWEATTSTLRATLEGWPPMSALLAWLDSVGAGWVRGALAPLIVIALALPVIVVLSLLLVALLMTPAIVGLVAKRRFARLERRHGAAFWQSAGFSLGCTLIALALLLLSIPFWFVPPLVLVLPPLIWGWLTYRVMSFDVLAEHASAEERKVVMQEHKLPLIGMGVVAGYLGAAPSLLWAVSAVTLIFAPLVIVVAVWLYTLVFAFSALWFAHYCLAALERLRKDRLPPPPTPVLLDPLPRPPGP